MMQKAKHLMSEFGASFIFSGEVVGQRPMSQRRDALRVVERDAGCDGLLVRPLCAKKMDPTQPEIDGLVDRERLCDLSGRSRAGQIAMAAEFGITDYPTPAGGCILTDPMVGVRIKDFYNNNTEILVEDMVLIQVGRHFRLPGGSWLVMGRKMTENEVVESLITENDFKVKILDRPGPTALLRYFVEEDLEVAAGLVARYAKKGLDGQPVKGDVAFDRGEEHIVVEGIPVEDSVSRKWLF